MSNEESPQVHLLDGASLGKLQVAGEIYPTARQPQKRERVPTDKLRLGADLWFAMIYEPSLRGRRTEYAFESRAAVWHHRECSDQLTARRGAVSALCCQG